MSYVIAVPEYVIAAAADLADIKSALSVANALAAGPTSLQSESPRSHLGFAR